MFYYIIKPQIWDVTYPHILLHSRFCINEWEKEKATTTKVLIIIIIIIIFSVNVESCKQPVELVVNPYHIFTELQLEFTKRKSDLCDFDWDFDLIS